MEYRVIGGFSQANQLHEQTLESHRSFPHLPLHLICLVPEGDLWSSLEDPTLVPAEASDIGATRT